MYKIDSKELASAIDNSCDAIGMSKKEFHNKSGISSATLSQWRKGAKSVKSDSIVKLEMFTEMSIEDFMKTYGPSKPSDQYENDVLELRQMLRDSPEMRMLFSTAKGATPSAILQSAALLARLKEEAQRNDIS